MNAISTTCHRQPFSKLNSRRFRPEGPQLETRTNLGARRLRLVITHIFEGVYLEWLMLVLTWAGTIPLKRGDRTRAFRAVSARTSTH